MLPVAAGMLLAACATTPRVMALPGSGKTLEQFNADDVACRQWAGQQASRLSQWEYDMAYMQCMYAKGNQIPATVGQRPSYVSPGSTGTPPPPPAGMPPAPPPASTPPAAPPSGTPPPPSSR